MRSGLIVVKRVWAASDKFRGPRRDPAVRLSREEIGRLYRGIDGDPWPDSHTPRHFDLREGVAAVDDLAIVMKYRNVVCSIDCDLVYITGFDEEGTPPSGFQFLGLDFGYYESEWSVFSVILQEVVYGLYPEMRDFASQLNDSLLAPSLDSVRVLERIRYELLSGGEDLETDTEMIPIAVYGLSEDDNQG